MSDFKAWLEAYQPKHLPKGPMGEAISYAIGQRDALTKFLTNARIPVDNNASENALRAAGPRPEELAVRRARRGWRERRRPLLARHDLRGERVNPAAYIADALLRMQTYLASRINELLPHRWKRQHLSDCLIRSGWVEHW